MKLTQIKMVPPLTAVIFLLVMWLIAKALPIGQVAIPGKLVLALLFAIGGVFLTRISIKNFVAKETTLNPTTPDEASSLVDTGVYQYTRNPMYLSLLIILIGWGIWLANWAAFLGIIGFVIVMNRGQIKREEKALTELFGDEYKDYCNRVRRWI